jgi:hypothetical protein
MSRSPVASRLPSLGWTKEPGHEANGNQQKDGGTGSPRLEPSSGVPNRAASSRHAGDATRRAPS